MPATASSTFTVAKKGDREIVRDSGMEGGAREGYERFDELLAEIQRKR